MITTEPAPTTTFNPILTCSLTDEPMPIQEFLPILVFPAIETRACESPATLTSCSKIQPVLRMHPSPINEPVCKFELASKIVPAPILVNSEVHAVDV